MSSHRTHLEVERYPIGSLAGSPPFAWSLPGEPVGLRQLILRQIVATFQVLACDPRTLRHIGGTGPMLRARVSTGEPLSVFPRDIWRDRGRNDPDTPGEFESRIIWLEPRHVSSAQNPSASYPGPDGPGNWFFRDAHRFELGLIWVQVFDSRDEGHQLTPRPLLARFLKEPAPDIPEPLIGLHWSIMTNRRLVRETEGRETPPPPQAARLEEWMLFD